MLFFPLKIPINSTWLLIPTNNLFSIEILWKLDTKNMLFLKIIKTIALNFFSCTAICSLLKRFCLRILHKIECELYWNQIKHYKLQNVPHGKRSSKKKVEDKQKKLWKWHRQIWKYDPKYINITVSRIRKK